MRRVAAATSLVLALVLASSVMAQRGPGPKSPSEAPAASKAKPAAKTKPTAPAEADVAVPPRPRIVMPDAEKIVLLVRTTLLTLNDALRTGNYTVLRDKAAPGFRDANSAARLGQIFANLASSRLDLSVVSVLTPQLSEAPVLDQERGTLNLKGYFATRPTQIDFEVLFQSVNGRWQVFGLSVQPVSGPQAPAVGSAEGRSAGSTESQR